MGMMKEKGALVPWASAKLMSPLPRPTLILAGGRAYRKHLIEMQGGDTKMPPHPHAFLKNGNARLQLVTLLRALQTFGLAAAALRLLLEREFSTSELGAQSLGRDGRAPPVLVGQAV